MDSIFLTPQREVVVLGKQDGDMVAHDHDIHREFVSVQQTHGNEIFFVSEECCPWKQDVCADALWGYGTAIGVYVADCLPLLLVTDQVGAAIHCSRRTLYTGLVHQVIDTVTKAWWSIQKAYLWPCITHYEVGNEFFWYFPAAYLSVSGEKYVFDLRGYVQSILEYHGIQNSQIIIDKWSTWTDRDTYRGYRRGDLLARNFVWVKRV